MYYVLRAFRMSDRKLERSTSGNNSRRRRKGAAVVELTVMLPVLVLIVLGTIEAVSMIFLQQAVEISAYEAARIALVPGTSFTDVEAAADTILVQRDIFTTSVSVSPTNFGASVYGTPVTVTVTADCSDNSMFGSLFYQGRTLTADVTMMKEE